MEIENIMLRDNWWKDNLNNPTDDEYDRMEMCEIYDCEDCPRYGYDCDGREDEDEDDE